MARAAGQAVFPARFVLVGTMNLCPCGARGDPAVECSCSPQKLAAYGMKLSRALLDRFDLVVHMPRPRGRELDTGPQEPSAAVRARVEEGAERLRRGETAARRTTRAACSSARSTPCRSRRAGARASPVSPRRSPPSSGAGEIEPQHVAEALSYRTPRELSP